MARLIEFFTRPGELVLDPFAGVGGTLLGAAIARGPRRALGFELNPRWAEIYAEGGRDGAARRAGALGPLLADLGPADPAGVRTFDPAGCELRVGDALQLLPELPDASVDFVATDPPYTVQLPLTMAGGRLATAHAEPSHRLRHGLRRSRGPRQRPVTPGLSRADGAGIPGGRQGAPTREIRGGDRPRCLPGRTVPLHRRGARGPSRGRRAGAQRRPDLVPGGHEVAAVRLPTGIRPEHRAPAHRRAAEGAGPRAASVASARSRGRPRGRHRPGCPTEVLASVSSVTMSPRVIRWSQPCRPSGVCTRR